MQTPASDDQPLAALQKHFDAAQSAEQQMDFVRAESEYRQALGMALEQLGEAYETLGDLVPAQAAFQGAVSARSDSETALLGLAVVYLRDGRFQKGVDSVRALLAQNPMHAQARQLLGKLYFSMNRFDAAAAELQEAQRLAPDDSETAVTLAFTYLREKQFENAQKIFADLLRKRGESPQIHITFGAAYRESEYMDEAVAEFKKAIALDPAYPRLHYYMALAYLSQEHAQAIPQATAELTEEIRRHPDEYSAHYLTGLIYEEQHKLEEAIPYFEKAASLDAANPDAPLFLGESLYLLNQTDRAVPLLKKSIELTKDPSHNQYQIAKAHYLLGQFYNRQGSVEEAKQQLALAEKYRVQTAIEDQQRLRIYLREGMGSGNDLNNALGSDFEGKAVIIGPPPPTGKDRENLQKACTLLSHVSAQAYNQLGLLRARESDFPRAAQFLQQAANWEPNLPQVQFNLGLALFKVQDYTRAVPALEKALSSEPQRQDIRTLLGLSCFFANNYQRAAEVLSPLAQSGAEDPQVDYALGLSLANFNQRALGMQVLQRLLQKYPDSADAHMAMGQALALGEEFGKAGAEFSRALELDPTIPEGHYYLGLTLLRTAKFADSAEEFRRELASNPRDAKSQYHLGLAFASLDQLQEAVKQFDAAIQLDPSYGDAYYEMGKAQLKQGETEKALANLEKAGQLEPDKSYVQYQLSQIYLKLGRNDAGKAALEKYRDLKAREHALPGSVSRDR